MSRIEAVILDWAGTTVDFGCMAPVQAFMEAFKAEGIVPTMDEIRAPMGMLKRDHVKAMMSMERIRSLWQTVHGREWDEDDVERVYEKSEKGIIDIVHEFASPKPYVLEAVKELRQRNIKIGSTTGYTDAMMEIVVPKAKSLGYEADIWFSPDSVEGCGRPLPYMIYKNMEALRISSVLAAVKVGDTVADIKEGKNAGVISVGIVEGSSVMGLSEDEFNALDKETYRRLYAKTEETFILAGADYVLPNMSALPALLEIL